MIPEIRPCLASARFVVFLLQISILVLISNNKAAAAQRDVEIELMETTYRVSGDDTVDVLFHQQWKALTAQGRADISQIKIPYLAAFDEVEIKFIKTIKKDGSIVNGDPASAFDTASSVGSFAPSFDDTKDRTILPPNLETGDQVEYEAVLHRRHSLKPGDFWFVHYLTTNVPVLSETVVLDLPADRKVALSENAANPGKTEVAEGRRVERWTAVNPEPSKAGVDAPAPLFAVSSMLSWDAFGEWVRSLNEKAAEPTLEITDLATKLVASKSSDQERIAALYGYVATKVRYVSVSFGIGRVQPHMASAVLHNAYGDCKDQTALLSALLKAAGFKPYAVLTTPGVGVLVPEVPMADQFSHEITAVNTKSGLAFLDTSMGPVAPGLLPPGVRGRSAVLIGDSTSSVIEIPIESPVPQRITTTLKGKVTGAGAFEGSTRLEFQGFAEPIVRRVFLDATDVEKEKILKGLAGPEFGNAKVRQTSTGDPADLTKPFWVQCELSDKDFFSPAKRSMVIKLEWPGSLAALLDAKKPDKPVPMEAVSLSRSMDLIVDTSLTVDNGTPVHLKTPFGAFDSEFSYLGGHLILKRSLEVRGAVIAPADWDSFLGFMRSAQDETARGFTLERHSGVPGTLSPLTQLIREGAAAYKGRDYEAAKRAYLEALKLDPKTRVVWNDLGRAYAALHEYDAAEKAFKRQIEIDPLGLYAYNNLGVLYASLKRGDDAIAAFRKQIAISPRDSLAHANLSRSLAAKQRWEEAQKEAAIAAEITPEDAGKWVLLGNLQIKTGHIQDARESYDRALAQVHDAVIENDIAYFMANSGIDLDKAWKLISGTLDPEARLVCQPETLSKEDKCSAQLRHVANMLDTSGWVLYRQGKLMEAEPYLLSAYAIAPRAEVEIHLSILFAKSGRLGESLKYFADARSRDEFSRVDSAGARRELANAIGSEAQLDSRLEQIQVTAAPPGSTARVIALVDEHGKVLEAHSDDPETPSSLVDEARSLTLPPISWPEHSLRSTRTIEFRNDGGKWSLNQSYVRRDSGPPANR